MKRKLVHKDLNKIEQFLGQLDITDKKVTFDLLDGVVEGHGSLTDVEGAEHEKEALSEEYIIAELARRIDLPEQTIHRYIQNCRAYFETAGDEIVLSPYNLKLLKALDELFFQGFTVLEVMQELREGNISIISPEQERKQREASPFPKPSSHANPVDFARKYFESANHYELSQDEEEEEIDDSGRGRKVVKWILLILSSLIAVAILISYQLGYIGAREMPSDPGYSQPPVMAEEREGNAEEETKTVEEDEEGEEPEIPAVPALLPEEITVDVLNGCGVSGAAGRFAVKLREAGYQVREIRDADEFSYTRSHVISRLENDEAWSILEMLLQAELLTEAPASDKPMVTVIIGKNDAI